MPAHIIHDLAILENISVPMSLEDDEEVPRERLTLAAAFARLLPPLPPDTAPGAVEAGAVEYVDRLFEQGAPGLRPLIAGLGLLERLALEEHGASFAALGPAQQDEILRELEGGPAEGVLRQLVLLALEGSFCHPARGGNAHGIGWRFAGVEPATDHPRCRAS